MKRNLLRMNLKNCIHQYHTIIILSNSVKILHNTSSSTVNYLRAFHIRVQSCLFDGSSHGCHDQHTSVFHALYFGFIQFNVTRLDRSKRLSTRPNEETSKDCEESADMPPNATRWLGTTSVISRTTRKPRFIFE